MRNRFVISTCSLFMIVTFVQCELQTAFAQQNPSDKKTAPAKKHGDIVLEPTSAMLGDSKVEFELGTLYVPENRSDPKSRLIGVGFARFKALESTDAPPTFHLPGGPGNSLLAGLQGSPARLRQIDRYRRVSDVVIVDQRGFSERGEILRFKHRTAAEPLDQPASLARSTAGFVERARGATAEFAVKGVDLRGYTVKECADDVDDLRKALGYERITLVGTSFGSQWSFAIMRRHPDRVARALLSGIEPLDYSYDMPSHIFAAVQRMWWEAEQDARFKPCLPPGGLMGAAREVLRRLERSPATVQVADGKSGETATIVLGREDFQRDAFLRGPDGPAFVLAAYYEHYEAWAAAVLAGRKSREISPPMIGPLIDSSLGVTPKREYLLRTDAGLEFLGAWNFDGYLATADVWPSPDVGDEFRTDMISQIPVVFAQGDWDTQTPVENALNVAPYFPNGRVLIAEHGGHGVLGPIADRLPEAQKAIVEFLQTGSTKNLPARVTLPAPKFTVPSFPPPTGKSRS
jgi:pimeloyl-ACP methyl ester carboxylesterase